MTPHPSSLEDMPRASGWEAFCAAARALAPSPEPRSQTGHTNPKKDLHDEHG